MPSLLDPVADSANWPEAGVGGGMATERRVGTGVSPWSGFSMGTTSYDVPTERDFMVDLTQGYGPEGFQNVVDPDQLAGIARLFPSKTLRPDPAGTNWGDVMSGSPDYLTGKNPPPPVPAGLLDYRLTTDGLGTPWVDKVKKKPAGILDTDPLDTTNQTGYRKSERFNNLMANMLVDYGANKLGKDDDWLWRETMR